MGLCVISLAFTIVCANEIIHPNNLNMCGGMSWLLRLRCALIRSSTMVKAFIGQFLLQSLNLFLKFLNLHRFRLYHLLVCGLELLLKYRLFLCHFNVELFFLLFEVINFLLQHLDVKFELLFDLDVLSDFGLIVLEFLLVFLWRQVNGLERGREFRCCSIIAESLVAKALSIWGLLIVI